MSVATGIAAIRAGKVPTRTELLDMADAIGAWAGCDFVEVDGVVFARAVRCPLGICNETSPSAEHIRSTCTIRADLASAKGKPGQSAQNELAELRARLQRIEAIARGEPA